MSVDPQALQQMIAQQQASGGPAPPPGGPAPPLAGPPGDLQGSPSEILQGMLELADQYRQVERDHKDLLDMEKVRTLLQQILAAQANEQDQMMQGKATPRAMRRAYGT
jgi:hypothetical protein